MRKLFISLFVSLLFAMPCYSGDIKAIKTNSSFEEVAHIDQLDYIKINEPPTLSATPKNLRKQYVMEFRGRNTTTGAYTVWSNTFTDYDTKITETGINDNGLYYIKDNTGKMFTTGEHTDLTQINESIQSLNDSYTILGTDITNLTTDINSNTNSINNLTNDFNTLNTQVNTNTNNINTLNNNLNNTNVQVNTNTQNIQTNANNINTLNNNLNNTNVQVNTNTQNINTLNTNFNTLNTQVNANSHNIYTNTQSINTLNTNLNNTNAQVNTNTQNIQTNAYNIQQNRQQIEVNTHNIQNNYQSIQTMNRRMDSYGRDITRINNRVNDLEHNMYSGLATVTALTSLHPNPRSTAPIELSIGTGIFRDSVAGAIGLFAHPTDNLMIQGGFSFGDDESYAGYVGITIGLGKKVKK